MTDNDEAVLRMLAGANFGPGAKVVLPSGREIGGDEAQALSSFHVPAAEPVEPITYTQEFVFTIDQQLAAATEGLNALVARHVLARRSLPQVAAMHGLYGTLSRMDPSDVVSLLMAAISERAESEA